MTSPNFPNSPTWRRVFMKWCSEHPPTREEVDEAWNSNEPVPEVAHEIEAWLQKKHSRGRTPLTPWQRANRYFTLWASNQEVSRVSAELKQEGVIKHRSRAVEVVARMYNLDPRQLHWNVTRQVPTTYKAKKK